MFVFIDKKKMTHTKMGLCFTQNTNIQHQIDNIDLIQRSLQKQIAEIEYDLTQIQIHINHLQNTNQQTIKKLRNYNNNSRVKYITLQKSIQELQHN